MQKSLQHSDMVPTCSLSSPVWIFTLKCDMCVELVFESCRCLWLSPCMEGKKLSLDIIILKIRHFQRKTKRIRERILGWKRYYSWGLYSENKLKFEWFMYKKKIFSIRPTGHGMNSIILGLRVRMWHLVLSLSTFY